MASIKETKLGTFIYRYSLNFLEKMNTYVVLISMNQSPVNNESFRHKLYGYCRCVHIDNEFVMFCIQYGVLKGRIVYQTIEQFMGNFVPNNRCESINRFHGPV
jgi:hypothetical protein